MPRVHLAVVASPQEPYHALLGEYHLCQAAWYQEFGYYKHIYRNVARLVNPKTFIILDWQHISTGAPEDIGVRSQLSFVNVIESLMPDEVVIPDAFKDREKTLANARNFLDDFCGSNSNLTHRLMFIPQGESVNDWITCLKQGVEQFGDKFQTVGVPKVLESFEPGLRREILDSGFIPARYDVHMLGVWGGINEMFYHHRVRSWDTSLPVGAAQKGVLLSHFPNTKYQLSEDYNDVCNPYILIDNVKVCQAHLAAPSLTSSIRGELPNWRLG